MIALLEKGRRRLLQALAHLVNEEGNVTYKWLAPNPGVEPDYDAIKAALA